MGTSQLIVMFRGEDVSGCSSWRGSWAILAAVTVEKRPIMTVGKVNSIIVTLACVGVTGTQMRCCEISLSEI